MPSAQDLAASMVAQLALTEPDLDTSIGSVARKIIDAAAGTAVEAFLDRHLTTYQYDIDSMSAGTLEGFVRLFGMNRQQSKFAVGTVTFTRSSTLAATTVARIPVGTQVLALTDPPQYVQTVASATMALAQTTIDVPVQAITSGSDGNIAAGLLTTLASEVDGVSATCINTAPLTGGKDAETDADLRLRWKQSVFRNLAGTAQMYTGMALQADDQVSAVNVLGAKKTWLDRITIASGTSGAISFGNPAYIYSAGVFVGNDIGALNLLVPGTNYTVAINNGVSPATITISAVSGAMPDGDYDIQFDYVPTYSRNDPFGTRWGSGSQYVNNRVDVWTNGSRPIQVTQACKFSTISALRFNDTIGSPLYRGADDAHARFVKLDGTRPSSGDYFMPLAFGPVAWVPSSIVISASTYTLGTHYDIVHQSDAFGFTPNSQFGLVWYQAAPPATGASFSMSYQYNAVPSEIQRLIESQWRLLGTDAQVHAGIANQYRFHFAIIYMRGFDTTAVNTAIDTALATLVNSLGFDSSLQVSDVLQAVHNVAGVDNVRFLNSTDDGTHYAIEEINLLTGAPFSPSHLSQVGGRASDLYFDDAHYPIFHSSRILTKTRTNFGAS